MINGKDIYRRLRSKKKINPPREDFLKCTAEFNKRIAQKILEGYKFRIPSVGGQLEIKVRERKKKSKRFTDINWDESLKYKQELIDKGEVPYNKETAPDGVKWFVYHEGPYCLWNWFRATGDRYKKNIMNYSFKVTRGPNGNARKMWEMFKKNPIAEITYDIHN